MGVQDQVDTVAWRFWEATMNACTVTAITPADREVVAEPVWTEAVRGVRLVDQDGHEWGRSFVMHNALP